MKINLHNHSTLSDGKLTPEQVVQAAINVGLTHVAITDHFASAKLTTRGVDQDSIAAYVSEIRGLAAKYAGRIKVLAGLEIDFSPTRTDFRFLQAPSPEESIFRVLDFVLLEYLGDPEWSGASLEDLIDVRPKIPCPVGLAHCHFQRSFEGLLPQTVIGILEQQKVFLELCPAARNASMIPNDAAGDRGKLYKDVQALNREMETLSKQLAESPNDAYLLGLRNQMEEQMDLVGKRFKMVPAYRLAGRFTRDLFTRIRGRKVSLSIGSDTHDTAEEVALIGDAVQFIEENLLQTNVITNFYWK